MYNHIITHAVHSWPSRKKIHFIHFYSLFCIRCLIVRVSTCCIEFFKYQIDFYQIHNVLFTSYFIVNDYVTHSQYAQVVANLFLRHIHYMCKRYLVNIKCLSFHFIPKIFCFFLAKRQYSFNMPVCTPLKCVPMHISVSRNNERNFVLFT